ncbi:MAG TPA: nuclear transport factor 2 family protein [Myxococcales bacterium]|nr:nuclear transport factor 2 family protein [Myxococcales bacterium]
MRLVRLLAPAALVACAHATIPGTNIPDEPENRAVLQVLAQYKQAMESRDPNQLLALAAPDYFDTVNSSRPNDPRDLEGLRRTLPKDFTGVRALRLDIDIRNLVIKGDQAQVDYFGVMRYALAVPNGEKWFTESDDQRMKFVRVGSEWKISSGM